MAANVVMAFAVGRLLERRFNLDRKDAFTYAFIPQFAGLPEVPALAMSIAMGRHHEVVPAPARPRSDTASSPGTSASAGGTAANPPGDRRLVPVPDVVQRNGDEARKVLAEHGFGIQVVSGPADGLVESQDPAAAAEAETGTTVRVRTVKK